MKKNRKFEKPEDREKVLSSLVEKAKDLKDGEKINATEFCNAHNIVNALFFEVYASATLAIENYDVPAKSQHQLCGQSPELPLVGLL